MVASWAHSLKNNYSAFLVYFNAAGIDQIPVECRAQCLQWECKSEFIPQEPEVGFLRNKQRSVRKGNRNASKAVQGPGKLILPGERTRERVFGGGSILTKF